MIVVTRAWRVLGPRPPFRPLQQAHRYRSVDKFYSLCPNFGVAVGAGSIIICQLGTKAKVYFCIRMTACSTVRL